LPLIPVTSLENMAAATPAEKILALLDARMGEIYSGAYVRQGEGYQLQGEIRVSSPADVIFPEGEGWLACGNGLSAYPLLAERWQATGQHLNASIFPQADVLARLAAPRFLRGEGIDPAQAVPLYIRDKVAKTVAERLREGGKA
jgi:tRNA threonylcarbamoyladenosine biosynthesis protein TsaB